jgi:hypothetical protein
VFVAHPVLGDDEPDGEERAQEDCGFEVSLRSEGSETRGGLTQGPFEPYKGFERLDVFAPSFLAGKAYFDVWGNVR